MNGVQKSTAILSEPASFFLGGNSESDNNSEEDIGSVNNGTDPQVNGNSTTGVTYIYFILSQLFIL